MNVKYRILPIGGGGATPSGSLTITENGVYDVGRYAEANVNIELSNDPVCFTATQDNTVLLFRNYGSNISETTPFLLCSFDGVNYYPYLRYYNENGSFHIIDRITLSNIGDKVYFIGFNPDGVSYANTDVGICDNYTKLAVESGQVEFSGDLTTLLDPAGHITELPDNAFCEIFCETYNSLIGNIDLSFVTHVGYGSLMRFCQDSHISSFDLSNVQYVDDHGMHASFARSYISGNVDLHSLTTVKDTGMWACFYSNPQITSADLSSLTTVVRGGDNPPFQLCFYYNTSLNNIKIRMPYWDTWAFTNWTMGVASTGDFYNLGGISIPIGNNGIPSGWTEHTSL